MRDPVAEYLEWGRSGRQQSSGGSTSKAMHAILSSSLTQVLHLFVTSSCPRRPHKQLSLCSLSYFSILHFLFSLFCKSVSAGTGPFGFFGTVQTSIFSRNRTFFSVPNSKLSRMCTFEIAHSMKKKAQASHLPEMLEAKLPIL